MSVPNQTPYNIYTANGLTTVFTYEFYIISASDLQVSINGDVVTSGYTVAGVGNKDGGDITFLTPPANGAVVMLERVVPTYRLTDYQDNGDLLADTVNKDFDRIWMAIQRAFIDLGLALTRPLFGGPFNAKGYKISNLGTPELSFDAATKLYVDTSQTQANAYADSLFKRTLRVPELSIAEVPGVSTRKGLLLGFNDIGRPVMISGQTSTADLAFKLAASTGAELVGYRHGTVYDVLNRMKTYSDYGLDIPVDGYDSSFYTKVFADKNSDNDLYLPGKLNIAADLFGTSNNAAALSILGNNDNSFRNQVVGGDTAALSNYGIVEDVLVYLGLSGRAAIKTTNPIYTVNSITITDGADISKVKRGSVIKTSDPYYGKVVALVGNVITVKEWRKAGVIGTPSGDTAYLNQIDKSYLANKVLWIPSSYTGTKAVGEEWDFYIANSAVTEKNGLDMVVHSSSVYGMDVAMLVRSAKGGVSWNTAVRAAGCSFAGFVSADGDSGVNASQASFYDMSTNAVGLRFNGNNSVHSIYWRYPNSSVYPSSLNPYGFRRSGGKVTANAVSGVSVALNNAAYNVINSSPFNIILPSTNLVAGQEIDFYMTSVGTITVTCTSSSVNVNGSSSYTYTPSKTFSRGIARWDGSGWAFNS